MGNIAAFHRGIFYCELQEEQIVVDDDTKIAILDLSMSSDAYINLQLLVQIMACRLHSTSHYLNQC